MFDILQLIPGKKKSTQSGWRSFNAVCCHHRGHTADKRGRGGIKVDNNNFVYHCFNCGFSCSFTLGRTIPKKTRDFLHYLGLDKEQIERYNLESLQNKDLLDFTQLYKKPKKIKFKTKELPDAELLDINNEQHRTYIEYLEKRNIRYNDYPFMCIPNGVGREKNGIIIPYTYKNKIVGHTTRFIDNRIPKFINQQQEGYVFGIDLQKPEYSVCIVCEGIFDALSVNGVALLHDSISDIQADQLNNLGKRIIVVPDQDKTGLEICDRALELGYEISLPNFEKDVKDINDAVVKYGKVPTVLSILQNATKSKIKIEMRRKQIDKRI